MHTTTVFRAGNANSANAMLPVCSDHNVFEVCRSGVAIHLRRILAVFFSKKHSSSLRTSCKHETSICRDVAVQAHDLLRISVASCICGCLSRTSLPAADNSHIYVTLYTSIAVPTKYPAHYNPVQSNNSNGPLNVEYLPSTHASPHVEELRRILLVQMEVTFKPCL